MPLLPEVEFGAFLVYSPKGTGEFSASSRTYCKAVKGDQTLQIAGRSERVIPYLADHVRRHIDGSPLVDLFIRSPVLVPAPRSAPSLPNSLRPTLAICQALAALRIGGEVRDVLERVVAVPKAAFSAPADRPTPQVHYDSLRVRRDLIGADEIVVVDDVITRGATTLAAISRLREAFPQATVRGFAMIRTMSGQEVTHLIEPCIGTIRLGPNGSLRRP